MATFTCEEFGCKLAATTEWVWRDAVGYELYSTYRCDDHPDTDPDYERYPLVPMGSQGYPLTWGWSEDDADEDADES